MKLAAASVLALCSISTLQGSVAISSASGSGEGVNYTVAFAGDTANINPVFAGNGDLAVGNGNVSLADFAVVTFTFSQAVDFTVTTALTSDSVPLIFDGGYTNVAELVTSTDITNTFASDTGSWLFTSGSMPLTQDLVKSNSGSTIELGVAGRNGPDHLRRGDDFGSLTIEGVTQVVWIKTNATNREAFNFSYTGTVVPEPTSALLASVAGALGLLRRRRVS